MTLRRAKLYGNELTLDTSAQRLRMDVPETSMPVGRLFAKLPEGWGAPFVSASVIAYKAKRVDDAIYEAIERAVQPAKTKMLAALVTALVRKGASRGGVVVVLAAAKLGGIDLPALDSSLAHAVDGTIADFLADPKASKPLGFYSSSADLARVFRQDRMLMTELARGDEREVMDAIAGDPAISAEYARHRAVAMRMTNPDAAATGKARIFHPSRSPEGELIERLFGDRPIPEGFDLVDEIASRVAAGTLSLAPRADSGWYDHQLFSLEPLVAWDRMPEAARVEATSAYRDHLRDVFRALFALTRETHVKQLMPTVAGGRPPEKITPDIVTEPLATMYARRADSYAFVREVLREASIEVAGEAIDRVETLLRGAVDAVKRDTGDPSATPEATHAERSFRDWAARAHTDPDLAFDPRMMVPVFHDIGRNKTKVWAVLGWSQRVLRVSYEQPPRVVAGKGDEQDFGPAYPMAFFPVTVELYVTKIRSREEMRQICDTHRDRAAIVAALEGA